MTKKVDIRLIGIGSGLRLGSSDCTCVNCSGSEDTHILLQYYMYNVSLWDVHWVTDLDCRQDSIDMCPMNSDIGWLFEGY